MIKNVEIEKNVFEDTWKLYGGHRFWHGPEKFPDSYIPDNQKIQYRVEGNRLILEQEEELFTKLQKTIELFFEENALVVKHILHNRDQKQREVCCWGISALIGGGKAILRRRPQQEGLMANSHIALWSYTDLTDSRLLFRENQLEIIPEESIFKPFKIGVKGFENHIQYRKDGWIFSKTCAEKEGVFADHDTNLQIYTCGDYIELETLSPLITLQGGKKCIHEEKWEIGRE